MSNHRLSFRCNGRSDRSEKHVIVIDGNRAQCSCQGVDWCSHIDATLRAGERYMIPEEDHRKADLAQRQLQGFLKAPEGWQASWREDRVWRGLAPPRSGDYERTRWDGRPTVAFLGSAESARKSDYVDHARSLGWRIVTQPTALTTLVVASDAGLATRNGAVAVALRLPIISHSEWEEWCYDFTHTILDRIEDHGFDPADIRKHAA